MDSTVLVVFVIVYIGMLLGGIPGLALDRTGVALLGAIGLLVLGKTSMPAAIQAVDVPTLALLFGLMVVSAQFRLSGFYSWLVRRLSADQPSPRWFLALVILASAGLSAVLANDIICLAFTPVLIESCARLQVHPKPYLLALACAANIGSAATLIGNPQNMLIGQTLHLDFGAYTLSVLMPVLLSLAVLWWMLQAAAGADGRPSATRAVPVEAPAYRSWQTLKGGILLALLMLFFLFAPWPREIAALAAAGILFASRRMHSRDILALIDWPLLLLFISLFVLNRAFAEAGGWALFTGRLNAWHIDLGHWPWLMAVSTVLANVISNVPSVMLLLPAAGGARNGMVLALASTLAGNLFLVGSIANLIVVEQARHLGVRISWGEHARVGVPVTLVSLLVSAAWIWLAW